jgi:hypothetical protein
MAETQELNISAFMDLVDHAKNYNDFIESLTSQYPPTSHGTFFALHGDTTVTAIRPQAFLNYRNAMVAYAPQMYAEVLYSLGDNTVHFQFVEEATGKISINAYTFGSAATVIPSPEHTLTTAQVRTMSELELIERTNAYAKVGCLRCHLDIHRRLVEPQNHGRRFQMDPDWVFRKSEDRTVVEFKLDSLFSQLVNGGAKTDPLYKWLWEQPEVKERGYLLPEDTFHYTSFVHDALVRTGHEMLTALKGNPKWPRFANAFASAVNGNAKLDQDLKNAGVDISTLSATRSDIMLLHAQINLKYLRNLNAENIAWILAEGNHDQVATNMNNSFLLLNRKSIQLIGPAILELVVTDKQWNKMSDKQKEEHVRLSELDVNGMDDLKTIVSTRFVKERVRRRTDTYLVLMQILNNRNKALAHISGSLSLNAISSGENIDLINVYSKALNATRPQICGRQTQNICEFYLCPGTSESLEPGEID